jgi:hypothetical protein
MLKKHSTTFLAVGIATVGLIVGVRHFCAGTCCASKGHHATPPPIAAATPAPAPITATIANATIANGDSVDPSFEGCKASCGSHSASLQSTARAQHQQAGAFAAVNDVVFCPVSGAAFRVGEEQAKRDVGGKSLYFCCPMCAAYFDAHRAEVLTARGIAPNGA